MHHFKVLLPVETAARELLYKLVLACRFATLGHDCYIGAKNDIYKLFSKVSPFVYFDKGYHQNVSDEIYRKIKQYGGIIANLDEEGGVDFKNCDTIAARYPERLFAYCDLIFLWGSAQYDRLHSKLKQTYESKIKITGHPRFDLLKRGYHFLYQDEVAKIKKAYNKYILISTNMGFGNNIRGDKFVKDNYGSRIKNINQLIEFDKIKVKTIVGLVEKLSPKVNETIIIRPHPEEKDGVYSAALNMLPNVKVIYEGSVIPWLIGAELMIHPDCTTGIESMMMGKKPISFLPANHLGLLTYTPVKVSTCFNDVNQLLRFILKKEYRNENFEIASKTLSSFFSFYCDSTDAIVKAISKKMCRTDGSKRKDFEWYYPNYLKFIEKIKKIRHFQNKSGTYRLQKKKMRGFKQDEIATQVRKISTLLLRDEAIQTKRINRYLYKIYRKPSVPM